MEVQKIASFEQHMADYRRERRHFLLVIAPVILLLGLGISVGMILLMTHFIDNEQNTTKAVLTGLLWGIALSTLPIQMAWPRKPRQADVIADQELRRAFSMDDTVDDRGN